MLMVFLVKLCVDKLVCDKYKELCGDINIDSNYELKKFLKDNCPYTCGYCSKLRNSRFFVVNAIYNSGIISKIVRPVLEAFTAVTYENRQWAGTL